MKISYDGNGSKIEYCEKTGARRVTNSNGQTSVGRGTSWIKDDTARQKANQTKNTN